MSVKPRGMSVQESYRLYREGALKVNRRYQRKLVWTLEEKRNLIDSILMGFPIPLILFATRTLDTGDYEYEILDGMQRLNAIFSFIENNFPVNDKYFDVKQLSRAQKLAEDRVFKIETSESKLYNPESCARFLEYTLAVTEFPANDEEAVNEVFSRLNSFGRQLSEQEKRQAGVVSEFSSLIREIASEVRGDVSREVLNLVDMPEISIDLEGGGSGNKISAEETFWCRQGVLQKRQIRASEDEQLVADLLISILEGEPFVFSGEKLSEYYDLEHPSFRSINTRLLSYGKESLKREFLYTLSVLRTCVEAVDPGPNALKRILNPNAAGNPIKTDFYAVFMAFFQLCVLEEKQPSEPKEVMRSLEAIHDRLAVSRGKVSKEGRRGNVNTAVGLIQQYFSLRKSKSDDSNYGLTITFENILRRSRIESGRYECKQGLLSLAEDKNDWNSWLVEKLALTACAIANLGKEAGGAIILGVADSREDTDKISRKYKVSPVEINGRYVVGVEREAQVLGISLDDYKLRLCQQLASSKLEEPLKTSLLSRIETIDYRGLSVIVMFVTPQSDVSMYGGELYVREGAQTVEVKNDYRKFEAVKKLFA